MQRTSVQQQEKRIAKISYRKTFCFTNEWNMILYIKRLKVVTLTAIIGYRCRWKEIKPSKDIGITELQFGFVNIRYSLFI